jgi:hypothetical protein
LFFDGHNYGVLGLAPPSLADVRRFAFVVQSLQRLALLADGAVVGILDLQRHRDSFKGVPYSKTP